MPWALQKAPDVSPATPRKQRLQAVRSITPVKSGSRHLLIRPPDKWIIRLRASRAVQRKPVLPDEEWALWKQLS
jgi:hypothetical protein